MAHDPNFTREAGGKLQPPATPEADYERNLGGVLGGRGAARGTSAEEEVLNNSGGVGRFRGIGPKGYRRSDARIHEEVCDRLAEDAALDPSEIEVAAEGGEVTLSGHVDRPSDRRRAEHLAESVSGVRYVHNRLDVHNMAR